MWTDVIYKVLKVWTEVTHEMLTEVTHKMYTEVTRPEWTEIFQKDVCLKSV